jgi:hypothetical protein
MRDYKMIYDFRITHLDPGDGSVFLSSSPRTDHGIFTQVPEK